MMPAQVLLVSGFLGAGKTTLINRLLREPGGRRIAAVVNDFGAVDIDAALLAAVDDGVMSLKNGCICCTLQSDLMRTLSVLMKREAKPDVIVIETSGISNPKDIVARLLDPVIFKAAALDTVVTVVDAAYLAETPAIEADPLWQAQVDAADILVISKGALVGGATLEQTRQRIRTRHPAKHQLDDLDDLPGLLLGHGMHQASIEAPRPGFTFPLSAGFETSTWTSAQPLSLARFQKILDRLALDLIRVKGLMEFVEMPGKTMLFQLVGTRATMVTAPVAAPLEGKAALVLIGRRGGNGVGRALDMLDEMAAS